MIKTTTCKVYQMYTDIYQQGKLVATLDGVSTHKWAPRNAWERWIEEQLDAGTPPSAGQYMVEGDGKISRYYLRYPEYIYGTEPLRRGLPKDTYAIGNRSMTDNS